MPGMINVFRQQLLKVYSSFDQEHISLSVHDPKCVRFFNPHLPFNPRNVTAVMGINITRTDQIFERCKK